jgi:hypothetical protein
MELVGLSAVLAVYVAQAVTRAKRLVVGVAAGAYEGGVQVLGAVAVGCDHCPGAFVTPRSAFELDNRVVEHLTNSVGKEGLMRVVANPRQILLEQRSPLGEREL